MLALRIVGDRRRGNLVRRVVRPWTKREARVPGLTLDDVELRVARILGESVQALGRARVEAVSRAGVHGHLPGRSSRLTLVERQLGEDFLRAGIDQAISEVERVKAKGVFPGGELRELLGKCLDAYADEVLGAALPPLSAAFGGSESRERVISETRAGYGALLRALLREYDLGLYVSDGGLPPPSSVTNILNVWNSIIHSVEQTGTSAAASDRPGRE